MATHKVKNGREDFANIELLADHAENLGGYVSWLEFSPAPFNPENKPKLIIRYAQDLLVEQLSDVACLAGGTPFEHFEDFLKRAQKQTGSEAFRMYCARLTKIFLHELAHSHWHLVSLLPEDKRDGVRKTAQADKDTERDA